MGNDVNTTKRGRFSKVFKFKSLRLQLVLSFLLLASVPLAFESLISFQQAQKSLMSASEERLKLSAEMIDRFIQNWFDYRRMDLGKQSEADSTVMMLSSLTQGYRESAKHISEYVGSADWTRRSTTYESDFETLVRRYDYIHNIMLIDLKGNVLFSFLDGGDNGRNLFKGPFGRSGLADAVRRSINTGEDNFSGFIKGYDDLELTGFLSTAVDNLNGERQGAIVIQLKLDRIFNLLVPKGGNDNFQHYLVGLDGVLQTPINGDWSQVLTRKINTAIYTDHLNHYDEDERFFDERAMSYKGPDGNHVIGVSSGIQIGNVKWILINEQYQDAALADAHWLGKIMLTMTIVSMVIVTLIAILIARRITQPIQQLADTSLKVAAGELNDHVTVNAENEIGQLADAFNHMLEVKLAHESQLRASAEETKVALEELRQQKFAVDQHSIVAITDLQGTITYVNDKFSQISGYSRDELIGQNHRILNSGYHPKEFFIDMYRTIASGQVWHAEIRNKAKNGSYYWVDTTVVPFKDDAGKPISYIAIRNDISGRKQIELEITEALSLQKSVLESTDNGILVTGQNGEVLRYNRRFADLWGFPEEFHPNLRVLGPIARQLENPDDFVPHIKVLIENETKRDYQVLNLSDGHTYEQASMPMFVSGKSAGRVWSFRDITKRVEAEKNIIKARDLAQDIQSQLEAEKQKTELAVESSGMGIWQWDLRTNELDWDERMHAIYETPAHAISSKLFYEHWFECVHPEDIVAAETSLKRAVELRQEWRCQFRLLVRDDVVKYVKASAAILLDEHGNPLKMIGSNQDVTVEHTMQRRLVSLKEEAELASKTKSEFLANMSHEIRTPMNGVLGMLALLLNTQLDEVQRHRAVVAQSSANALLTLINDILDFSKVDAGKLELENIDFDLRGMLGEFVEAMALQAEDKGLELVLDLTGVDQSKVKGDPGRLRQILTNLVGNAIKFTEEGEIVIRCWLTALEDKKLELKCTVTDTGIGIPDDKIDDLFESFNQGDTSTTRQYGGTGLGLSISKRLSELMGGGITVVSGMDEGSCFEVRVELNQSDKAQTVMPSIAVDELNLLVVDDNETNLEVLAGQLRHWGASVVEAQSAEEALERCNSFYESHEKCFDVLFLDMQMPGMDGAELSQHIHADERFSSAKLVMMTSMANRGDAQRFASLGFSAYFPKPVTTSDIFDALQVVVDGGPAFRQASPLVTSHTIKELKHATELREGEAEAPQGIVRLLVVEDNQVNQMVITGVLEELGYNVEIAANGLISLDMLKAAPVNQPYDLILMDCQMPEMDGYEATKAIRQGRGGQQYIAIPIIAMTANAMQGDREKCISVGMDDYLSKPVDAKDLSRKLNRWLQEKTVSEEEAQAPEFEQSLLLDLQNIPVWDQEEALDRIMGKADLLGPLLEIYLADAPPLLAEIEAAIQALDWPAVACKIHALKGMAANLSASQLHQISKEIEQQAKAQDANKVEQLLPDLMQASEQINTEFTQFITALNTSTEQISKEKMVELLRQIVDAVSQTSYIDATEFDELWNSSASDELAGQLKGLQNSIGAFDFEKALESLKALEALLNADLGLEKDKPA